MGTKKEVKKYLAESGVSIKRFGIKPDTVVVAGKQEEPVVDLSNQDVLAENIEELLTRSRASIEDIASEDEVKEQD